MNIGISISFESGTICPVFRRAVLSLIRPILALVIALADSAAQETKVTARHNYLKLATEFAQCMINHGRDRYGDVHSPLFAVLLTRENPPSIGPHPIFDSPAQYDWQKKLKSPFREFNYNRCLNYPSGLGAEGPHKVTIYGCDPYEDRALYEMLMDLTRITGNQTYRKEAEKALRWWFRNTLGPADLYPWGEHLGWDFEHECPTYFKGPSKHLYAACYHEIKDFVPFLDILAAIPAERPGERTPLEKYALGVWNAHFWDKERGIYCRHGDYTGKDSRAGSLIGFPAHQGAYLRLWVKTYLTSTNSEVKQEVREILNRILNAQTTRASKYGFIPFTFEVDLKEKTPKRNEQSDRLGRHALVLSMQSEHHAPELSMKLRKLGLLILGEQECKQVLRKLRSSTREFKKVECPNPSIAKLRAEDHSEKHSQEIIRRVEWFVEFEDPAYLRVAEQQAAIAYELFCDEVSPLPKAYSGLAPKTVSGQKFPDFYFRGAKLMHAFALLGEALEQNPQQTHRTGSPMPQKN